MNFRSLLSLRFLGALVLALIGNITSASAAEQAAAPAAAPEYTDEQKALLKALDSELGRFETLIGKVDDAKYAEFLKGQLQGLKTRRDGFLKTAFDSGKYDELRYDLNVEYQRAAQWLAPSIAPAPASKK
jgi:hypothetical protein